MIRRDIFSGEYTHNSFKEHDVLVGYYFPTHYIFYEIVKKTKYFYMLQRLEKKYYSGKSYAQPVKPIIGAREGYVRKAQISGYSGPWDCAFVFWEPECEEYVTIREKYDPSKIYAENYYTM